jgi:hypothetical protein
MPYKKMLPSIKQAKLEYAFRCHFITVSAWFWVAWPQYAMEWRLFILQALFTQRHV